MVLAWREAVLVVSPRNFLHFCVLLFRVLVLVALRRLDVGRHPLRDEVAADESFHFQVALKGRAHCTVHH